jgi:hypothetical protein
MSICFSINVITVDYSMNKGRTGPSQRSQEQCSSRTWSQIPAIFKPSTSSAKCTLASLVCSWDLLSTLTAT